MMFLDCPAYLDAHGALRCGLPAEVEDRCTMRSTDGPVEILKIRCPAGHWFNGPLDALTPQAPPGASGSPDAARATGRGVSEAATAGPGRTR
jgi:hypothetical protein